MWRKKEKKDKTKKNKQTKKEKKKKHVVGRKLQYYPPHLLKYYLISLITIKN